MATPNYKAKNKRVLAAIRAHLPYFILRDKSGNDWYAFAQVATDRIPLPVLAELLGDYSRYDYEELVLLIGYEPVAILSKDAEFYFDHTAVDYLKAEIKKLKTAAKESRLGHAEVHTGSDHSLTVGYSDYGWRYFFPMDGFIVSSSSGVLTYRPEIDKLTPLFENMPHELVYQIGEQINLAELFDQA